jgi:PAS domain S-box-containing protein
MSPSLSSLELAQEIAHLGSWELELSNLEDVNANRLSWSDEVFRIFGYKPEEIEVSNKNFFKAVHPDDRERISVAVANTIKTGQPYDINHRIIRADGSVGMVHEQGRIVRDDSGRPARLVGVVQDITKNYLLAREAEETRRLYKSLFEIVPLGLGIADMQGNLLFYNGAMMQPGGYSREEIEAIGNVARLYYDTNERDVALSLAREQGFLDRHEVRFRRKDGGFYHALLSLRSIKFRGAPCWLAMVEDISLRKHQEEDLVRRAVELERLNALLVGREVKMAELKKKIKYLEEQLHGR